MYYEINVSKNGKHLFATAEKSCQNYNEARNVYNILKEKFPEKDGYIISMTRWEKLGEKIL